MPELPEVETTRRGIALHICGKQVRDLVVRQPQLRWPVPKALRQLIRSQKLHAVDRRAKYLLLDFDRGTLLIHLGMSGSLRIQPPETPPGPHDHVDLLFDDCCLRLRDPRRFGALLWTEVPAQEHDLLRHLGPEPLSEDFTGEHLYRLSRRRRGPVKNLIMDGKVVVGVGNIYANESLFFSGIHPRRPANRISRARYDRLASNIKQILTLAIRRGGTTLRDFRREDGKPGYFAQELQVYGKQGKPCPGCGQPIRQERIGQRSSFFCKGCQR